MKNAKNDNFFSSIKLCTKDVLTISGTLILCLIVYVLVYIIARATGIEQITVEKFRDIIFYPLLGIVIFVVYKYRLRNFSFLGISQENLIQNIQRALAYVFLFLFIKTSFGFIFNKSILERLEKKQIEFYSNSLLLFFIHISVSIIIVPIFEEIIFRGFFYPPLRTRFGVLWGTILSSIVFTLWHSGASVRGIINIFIIGVILAYLYEKSRSLVPSMIFHSILNLDADILILNELLKTNDMIYLTQIQLDSAMLIIYLILSSVFYFSFRRKQKFIH